MMKIGCGKLNVIQTERQECIDNIKHVALKLNLTTTNSNLTIHPIETRESIERLIDNL